MFEHKRDNRVHAEKVLEANVAEQTAVAAFLQPFSVDGSLRSPVDEPADSPKVFNPLERIDIEHQLLVKAVREGISSRISHIAHRSSISAPRPCGIWWPRQSAKIANNGKRAHAQQL